MIVSRLGFVPPIRVLGGSSLEVAEDRHVLHVVHDLLGVFRKETGRYRVRSHGVHAMTKGVE